MVNKLLFFASDYKIGLTYLLTEELIFLNNQQGIELMAIAGHEEQTPGLSEKLAYNNINNIRIKGLDVHKNFFGLATQISQLIKTEKFSFVHVQNNWQLALLVFIKLFFKVDYKIIYTIHGYRHNSIIKSLFAKKVIDIALYLFADKVFVASSEVRHKFRFSRKKSNVLYLGVENDFFDVPKPDFESTHKNLIFAGQFRKGKNQQQIISAISEYIKRTGNKDFTLYLPGEGPLRNKCIEHAKLLKIQDNVVFSGQLSRKEIITLYSQCQIAIVPTNSETFGHCIAEPFVIGMCVITKNVGIANDVIKDGSNGLLFENTEDLTTILEKHLTDNAYLSMLSDNAYQSRELFRWSSICTAYNKALNF